MDALAVAVGNVHGMSSSAAQLDIEHLARIAALTPVPLVLHGASGVSDDNLAAAVSCGVVKVNINTELRRAYLGSMRAFLAADSGDNVMALQRLAVDAMAEIAREKMTVLATARLASTQRRSS